MNLIYTQKEAKIEINSLNDTIVIWFFGDVHRDTDSCDVDCWHDFLKESAKDKEAYYFGMGDYHDFVSTSEKKKIKHTSFDVIFSLILNNCELLQQCTFLNSIGRIP